MASPIETPTWEREIQCGCKGCGVARNNEKKRILSKFAELTNDIKIPWTVGSLKKINDLITELMDEK